MVEVNFDGLVGPTYNDGLSAGVAPSQRGGSVTNPRAAALAGLEKMRLVRSLGLVQAVLPPHPRPNLSWLRRLGFGGDEAAVLRGAASGDGMWLRLCSNPSAMWAANAATVAPSSDTRDGKVHVLPANLQHMLHQGQKQKALYACLETSSHGLAQGRLEGINFQIGIFTNLTQDHLDYHRNMEAYYRAKRRLFEYMLFASRKQPETAKGSIVCIDDDYGRRLYHWLKGQNPSFPVISLSTRDKNADAYITDVEATFDGYRCVVVFAQKSYFIKTRLLGRFNLVNLASVFLSLLCLGFGTDEALEAIQQVEPVPGRFEVLRGLEQRTVIIDYAHSPDALAKVLETAQELTPARVIGLFGCGGDRDKEKRPQMAEVASLHADLCILTNDNPRSEDPKNIIEDMRKGLKTARYLVITDREKAIRAGLQILGPRQVLVIAGKGHEDYQIIGNKTLHFSDRETALKLMSTLKIR